MTVESNKALTVIVHPLVLLSVVDHYHRVIGVPPSYDLGEGSSERQKRVVGVLLGQVSPVTKQVNVSNSFAVPFEEDEKNENVWFMDVAYIERMFELFKKVSAREKIIGWYHTGPKLKSSDLQIHQLFRKYIPNPVLVIIDVEPRLHGIPTDAYLAVEQVQEQGKESAWTFTNLSSQIEAEEAEEIGVEHLLRDIREHSLLSLSASKPAPRSKTAPEKEGTRKINADSMTRQLNPVFESGIPLSQRLGQFTASLKSFSRQLSQISSYLTKVSKGELPLNQSILSMLQNILYTLPQLEVDENWQTAATIKSNDEAAVNYLATMIRSIIALHDLVDNKLQNIEKEKQLVL